MINKISVSPRLLAQVPPSGFFCVGEQSKDRLGTAVADVSDKTDPTGSLTVWLTWRVETDGATGKPIPMNFGDGLFGGNFSVPYAQTHLQGGKLTVTVHARDRAGNEARPFSDTIALDTCRIAQIPQ